MDYSRWKHKATRRSENLPPGSKQNFSNSVQGGRGEGGGIPGILLWMKLHFLSFFLFYLHTLISLASSDTIIHILWANSHLSSAYHCIRKSSFQIYHEQLSLILPKFFNVQCVSTLNAQFPCSATLWQLRIWEPSVALNSSHRHSNYWNTQARTASLKLDSVMPLTILLKWPISSDLLVYSSCFL
jgi:hypothetical protein